MSKENISRMQMLGQKASRVVRKGIGEALLTTNLTEGVDIQGLENIENIDGPAIHAFNHMSFWEIFPVLGWAPHDPYIMSRKENHQNPLIDKILRAFRAFPVDRDNSDAGVLRSAARIVWEGSQLMIAPEGTRGRDKYGNRTQLKPAEPGIVAIAVLASRVLSSKQHKQVGIPIIPWAVWGGSEAPFFPNRTTHVRIGKPINIIAGEIDISDKEKVTAKTDEIMLAIRDMLPEEYHGYYCEDLVRYRKEFKEKIKPTLDNNPQIAAPINQDYYSVYKLAADKFNVPWYLLWMIHNRESGCSQNPSGPFRLAKYGAMGRNVVRDSIVDVEETVDDPFYNPLNTVPLINRQDWKEIVWTASKLAWDAQLKGKGGAYWEQVIALNSPSLEETKIRNKEFKTLQEIFEKKTTS